MVFDWSPEPPREVDDRMSYPTQAVLVESDESEDDMLGQAPSGYELLAQGPVLGPSSDEENESDSDSAPTNELGLTASANVNTQADVGLPSTSQVVVQRTSEVQEVDLLYSTATSRPDLAVDCDQVRAAMVGFTLPPSAIPAWAANIPEGQLTTLLTQQIQRIQGQSNS
ncbi:uncharacterized protein LOC128986971 [Macrosteles quadrilineatus]|uniref:uncharacterized protein LOC128986660 n=1 Tax=Macrosteles quadrilineatus TaxID=74068 RepID=UPI0023E215B8|nr:uncharacterized protein LOC128986660 [Macrosteles quadrilineatus]XP_054263112.1 uncharacterized protein LOC128986660 [Macrosteles quadrilineatus]XP_054263113.1 uncharacterized protein LOC128986660 [Macrosteles quadrilineatus]XP_054263582.1 uncharacterized protein LOC128986971 [Macrosteles quadrilineatus]XP_054263583.1 uncharacterized protein LOC128986971 [Macrosteles quadrilineatus]XP_054263584.1 uncharacterized protein LOC128986971 [Macrosteles quadrilineatus]